MTGHHDRDDREHGDLPDALPDTIELEEWSSRTLEGVRLNDSQRQSLEQLDRRDTKPPIRWRELRRGLYLETRGAVGLVPMGSTTLHIIPRLLESPEVFPLWIDYCSGLDSMERHREPSVELAEGAHWFELLALQLFEEVRNLLQRGLEPGYVEQTGALDVLRGRLQPRTQYLERFGQFDRIHCRFDDRDLDTWENRLVALALRVSAAHLDHPRLRHRARQLERRFDEICHPSKLDRDVLERPRYHRGNAHYRRVHAYARTLVRGTGMSALDQRGAIEIDAFWIRMSRLFEQFVERLVRDNFDTRTWHLESQVTESGAIVEASTREARRSIRPDFVLTSMSHPSVSIPIDAKYKPLDGGEPPMADLRQAALYAHVCSETAPSPGPDAALVYPSDHRREASLAIRGAGDRPDLDVAILELPVAELLESWEGGALASSVWTRLEDGLSSP